MIFNLLLTILILDAVVLVASILLQSGKGGGIAANFGGQSSSDQFIGIRQAGTLLTKASWWCGGIFMGLAFVLQLMSTHQRAPRSVLEKSLAAPTAPATATPAPGATGASAIPLEPQTAPATTPDSSKR
ncbi:MAG: preprotein translocase subunit SecG [Gemmatimonadaceae bacterium]|nr:preprotein translocase subunit SecG [Gemmatimonadaceae bacterium]